MPHAKRRLVLAICCWLLLGAAAGMLWVRSYRSGGDRVSCRLFDDRYTLRSWRGQLRLMSPPGEWPPVQRDEARAIARRISNADVTWRLTLATLDLRERGLQPETLFADLGNQLWVCVPFAFVGDPHLRHYCKLELSALARPLLRALEDPRRAHAAHCILLSQTQGTYTVGRRREAWATERHHTVGVSADDLLAYIDVEDAIEEAWLSRGGKWEKRDSFVLLDVPADAATIDPAQYPALCQLWHDRLDVQAIGVPHWGLVAFFLLLLLRPACRYVRMRRRQRSGQCAGCGYDLRHKPPRCPECGEPSPAP